VLLLLCVFFQGPVSRNWGRVPWFHNMALIRNYKIQGVFSYAMGVPICNWSEMPIGL
jgi:hypothetical protein